MSIREKIQTSEANRRDDNVLDKTIRQAFIRIMCGYLGGTVIGFILRRLLHG